MVYYRLGAYAERTVEFGEVLMAIAG